MTETHPSEPSVAALRLSEARLRTIVQSEPECVQTVDAELRLLASETPGTYVARSD